LTSPAAPVATTSGIPGPLHNTAIQSDGFMAMSETVVTPQPSHYAVGTFPNILNLLQDGNADTLPDFAGPLFNVDGHVGLPVGLPDRPPVPP
jgi:hypothetical protein